MEGREKKGKKEQILSNCRQKPVMQPGLGRTLKWWKQRQRK